MYNDKVTADKELIKAFLENANKNIEVITVKETSSTNDDVKKLALTEKSKIVLYIAERQTKGRGRMGRSFYSPHGTGIYMSLLLRPDLKSEDCTLLTPMCAVALSEAIEKVLGISSQIKWVNDIYIGSKKVAGILTEGAFSGGRADYAVVGIGVNLSMPEEDFPLEIKNIAGSLTKDRTDFKNELIAETVNRFMSYYRLLPERAFLQKYRDRLFFLGQEITVISAKGSFKAVALGIDSDCRLRVRLENGEEKYLGSGEISIKPQ